MLEVNESGRYTGWSSAYTVHSILMQLQSFLFAENIPQDYGKDEYNYLFHPRNVNRIIAQNLSFKCVIDAEHTHTHNNPWPPFVTIQRDNYTIGLEHMVIAEDKTKLSDLPAELLTVICGNLSTQDLYSIAKVSKLVNTSVVHMINCRQICCFHTKLRYGSYHSQENTPIFGVGLTVFFHPDRNIKNVNSSFDIMTRIAFEMGVRKSVWNESFDRFMPIAITRRHFEKAIPCLMNFTNGMFGNDAKPVKLLDFIAMFMNCTVLKLFKVGSDALLFASEAAIDAYCGLHQLLLCAAERWPQIQQEASRRVEKFNTLDGSDKKSTPDLGQLLIFFTLSQRSWFDTNADQTKPEDRKPIKIKFIEEMLARNVLWVLRKDKDIYFRNSSALERVQNIFKASETSLRLVSFQIAFLNILGRPAGITSYREILNNYESLLGKPTAMQRKQLQNRAKRILQLPDWPSFFQSIHTTIPTVGMLDELLKAAVLRSSKRGYHGGSNRRQRN